MWNSEDDSREPVKLFVPVQAPPRRTNTDPLESHIGGHCPIVVAEEEATCDKCGNVMYLMSQLRLKAAQPHGDNDRYLCLFVCPRTECFAQLSMDKGFSSGGQGLVKCVERRLTSSSAATAPATASTPAKASWYADDRDGDEGDDDDKDDWALDGVEGTDVAVLEQAVAAMEQNLDESGRLVTAPATQQQSTRIPRAEARTNAFPCYILKAQDEPLPPRPMLEEDDVGLAESDEKIRNMLARYMAEEDDEDILAALRGSDIGGGSGKAAEEDERLSEEDRILRGFQDRLRRLPRQVIRYARGGAPLWSAPDKSKKSGKKVWSVPPCEHCQQARTFEFQVLPSILETLEVDNHGGNRANQTMGLDDMLTDGMNFGSIAVFACNNSACDSLTKDSFVVIQKSVDDMDSMKRPAENALPSATMAVVENLDDDDEFEPDQ
jgi:pre-rRNA-processing protein TSR4